MNAHVRETSLTHCTTQRVASLPIASLPVL